MPDDTTVPQASVNEKIRERIAGKQDYLARLESPFRRRTVTLQNALMKRIYLRTFDSMQLSLNVISVLGRANLKQDVVTLVEQQVQKNVAEMREFIAGELRAADALLQSNGLSETTLEFLAPMSVEARIISPISREYLDAIERADALLAAMELLVIEGVIQSHRAEQQKSEVRNKFRKVASSTRKRSLGVKKLAASERDRLRKAAEEASSQLESRREAKAPAQSNAATETAEQAPLAAE